MNPAYVFVFLVASVAAAPIIEKTDLDKILRALAKETQADTPDTRGPRTKRQAQPQFGCVFAQILSNTVNQEIYRALTTVQELRNNPMSLTAVSSITNSAVDYALNNIFAGMNNGQPCVRSAGQMSLNVVPNNNNNNFQSNNNNRGASPNNGGQLGNLVSGLLGNLFQQG